MRLPALHSDQPLALEGLSGMLPFFAALESRSGYQPFEMTLGASNDARSLVPPHSILPDERARPRLGRDLGAAIGSVEIGAEEKDFVVFGESLSDAAKTAERRIAERIPHARVLEIATVAEAL